MSSLVHGFKCRICHVTYIVNKLDVNIGLLKGDMPCPIDKCPGLLFKSKTANGIIISALALFKALGGAGLPEESCKGLEPRDIVSIFLGKNLVRIDAIKSSQSDTPIIRSLTFSNGKTMHLASSTRGATVYKITEGKNAK